MLICTNDGFTGLDGVKLPDEGRATYWLNAYGRWAGTEHGAQCGYRRSVQRAWPSELAGDPNGNR